ncbi:MAG: hypothetical protein ACJAU6_000309 [Alphaproteobacteria bacterium]|jgi:hypothetical protein
MLPSIEKMPEIKAVPGKMMLANPDFVDTECIAQLDFLLLSECRFIRGNIAPGVWVSLTAVR